MDGGFAIITIASLEAGDPILDRPSRTVQLPFMTGMLVRTLPRGVSQHFSHGRAPGNILRVWRSGIESSCSPFSGGGGTKPVVGMRGYNPDCFSGASRPYRFCDIQSCAGETMRALGG